MLRFRVEFTIQYLTKVLFNEKDKVEKGEKISSKIMYIATDEKIQDANKIKNLLEIAKKTNTTVKFLVFYEKGTKVIKLDLEDIDNEVEELAKLKIAIEQEKAKENLSIIEKSLDLSVNKLVQKFMGTNYDYNQTFGALEKASIEGVDKITIDDNGKKILKEILLDKKNFFKLMSLGEERFFKEFIDLKKLEANAKWNMSQAEKLTIDNKLVDNITLDPVSDYLSGQNK
jgi:hypothetical protein